MKWLFELVIYTCWEHRIILFGALILLFCRLVYVFKWEDKKVKRYGFTNICLFFLLMLLPILQRMVQNEEQIIKVEYLISMMLFVRCLILCIRIKTERNQEQRNIQDVEFDNEFSIGSVLALFFWYFRFHLIGRVELVLMLFSFLAYYGYLWYSYEKSKG